MLKVITYTLLVGSFPFAGRDGDTAMLQRISGGKCGDLGWRLKRAIQAPKAHQLLRCPRNLVNGYQMVCNLLLINGIY